MSLYPRIYLYSGPLLSQKTFQAGGAYSTSKGWTEIGWWTLYPCAFLSVGCVVEEITNLTTTLSSLQVQEYKSNKCKTMMQQTGDALKMQQSSCLCGWKLCRSTSCQTKGWMKSTMWWTLTNKLRRSHRNALRSVNLTEITQVCDQVLVRRVHKGWLTVWWVARAAVRLQKVRNNEILTQKTHKKMFGSMGRQKVGLYFDVYKKCGRKVNFS